MSGPKVVRVVTREELVAAGEALLRRLNAAVEDWVQACAHAGAPASEVQATRARRDALEAALRSDRFGEFGTKATAEIGFLEGDNVRRIQVAAKARAQALARVESGHAIAVTLLRGSTELSKELREQLEEAIAGKLSVAELDAVLSKAIRSQSGQKAVGLSESQRAIAARLVVSEQGQAIEEWRAGRLQGDPRVQTLLEQMMELELIGELAPAAALRSRMNALHADDGDAAFQLRLDSIRIAVSKAKEIGLRRGRALKDAKLMVAELSLFDDAPKSMLFELNAATGSSDLDAIDAVLARARKELQKLQAARIANSRRRVVLDALAKLGYSVNEGLSTATEKSGKLVMRAPENAGYGVEISGAGSLDRLQVRTVAFDSARDASGDIPAEQRWCGDFGKLQAALNAQGSEIVIEKAMGVGAVPVKVLQSTIDDDDRRAKAPSAGNKAAN